MALMAIFAVSLLGACKRQENGAINSAQAAPAQKRANVSPGESKAATLPSGNYHEVFSFKDNRLLGHLLRDGGLFIPVGYPGAAKYMNFKRPWITFKLNQHEDGRRVAIATKSVSKISFPLTKDGAQATTLALSLKSAKPQAISLTINGQKLKPVKIEAGWQKAQTEIPAKTLRAGENSLELIWGATGTISGQKSAAALEWVHFGKASPTETAAIEPMVDGKLLAPRNGGFAYYVQPLKGAKLNLQWQSEPAAGSCQMKVRQVVEGSDKIEEQMVAGEAGAAVDLAALAAKVGRIEIIADGAQCQRAKLMQAGLVMPGTAPKVKRGEPPKYVLFWMMDNARADKYALYNPTTRVKTPVITELGKNGTVFTHAYIQGTESRVSHASLWTGLYPKQHDMIDAKARLSTKWETLPKAIKKTKRFTAAWTANGFVSKFWGFGEGWDYFHNNLHSGGGLTGQALADAAIDFIEEKGEQPWFLYLGTIDSHVSWRGRQPWLKEYHPEAYTGQFMKDVPGLIVEKLAAGRPVSDADKKRIIAIYDSTVSYNDQQLGRLIEVLKKQGIFEKTMIIITADHGEEMWDFGRIGHGCSLHNQLTAVPLIIHYPPLFGQGVRVEQGADVLSLLPTIVDALGGTIPDTAQGESLLPLAQNIGAEYPRPALATQYELAHSIWLDKWKLWVGGKGEPRLFDMQSKQGERKDLFEENQLAARWLTDGLSTFMVYQNRWRASRWGVASNHYAAMPDDLEAKDGGPKLIAARPSGSSDE